MAIKLRIDLETLDKLKRNTHVILDEKNTILSMHNNRREADILAMYHRDCANRRVMAISGVEIQVILTWY